LSRNNSGGFATAGQYRTQQILQERAEDAAEAEANPLRAETEALAAAEARLPSYLTLDSNDLDDNGGFVPTFPAPRAAHDDEAGLSVATTTFDTSAMAPPPAHDSCSCTGHSTRHSSLDLADIDTPAGADAG
jgi:hypothetical protein